MEIDPVILELRAEMGRYKAELKSTTALGESSFRRQEQAIKRLEQQIKASSSSISRTLVGLSGAFAGAFSAQQVAGIIDSYTRFQNQLKVTGLEGESLARIQERLLAVAQRNGVGIEAVGTLYSRAAQNQRELGASSGDLIDLTSAVAASLKISGTSAQEASGALLQLGQALGSPRVQAEEFNSLLDTLQPLLREAAKRIDGTGGSLSGLTRKIKDTTGAGVSNVELFRAITASLADLEKTAGSAGLTISAAFTKLTNQLTVYIGESAKANGVTAAVAGAMELLANNLDTVADALSVIAAIALGRFVAGMTAAAASSGLVSTAIFAVQARAVAAATTMEALALVSATAGRAMLAAFGGVVGITVTALALGIGYLVTQTDDAVRVAEKYKAAQDQSRAANDALTTAVDKLATAHGAARKAALAEAEAQRQNAIQKRNSAKASLDLARAELARIKTFEASVIQDPGLFDPGAVLVGSGAEQNKSNAAISGLEKTIADADKLIAAATAALKAPEAASIAAVSTGTKGKKSRGSSGPSAAEVQADFEREMLRLRAEQLQDELQITTDAAKRADAQGQLNQLAYEEQVKQYQADKNFTQKQKAALIARLGEVYGVAPDGSLVGSAKGAAINREYENELARIRSQELQDLRDTLDAEAQLVDGRVARLEVEKRILEVAQEEERNRLEAAIATGEIADTAKARANLERRQSAERTGLNRQYESPMQAYQREIYGDINDQLQNIEVQGLRDLTDELTKATTGALGLKGALGNIVSELIKIGIQRQIIGPLADALFGGSGGGGGGLGSVIGSLFGRASGGPVAPGSLHRVNEHAGGVELLRMGPQGGQIIPLGQTGAMTPQRGDTRIYQISVSADNSVTPAGFAQGLAAQILAEAKRMDAQTAQATLKATPGAISRANRYGS